jgi:hypothetical protein
VSLYEFWRAQERPWQWPTHLLPICEWGAWITSCVDCSSSQGAVIVYDPYYDEPAGGTLSQVCPDLESWLQAWVDGVQVWDQMYAIGETIRQGRNPFNGEPILIPSKRMLGRRIVPT